MNIALACSAGGHLTELQQLEPVYSNFRSFFVTFQRCDTAELPGKVYYVTDPKRHPLKLLKNLLESLRIVLRERPDVVITTGAGVVIPFCYLAKVWGTHIIYIESVCRVDQPSLTGRLLYHIADLFLVQWEEVQRRYGPQAQFWGRLL